MTRDIEAHPASQLNRLSLLDTGVNHRAADCIFNNLRGLVVPIRSTLSEVGDGDHDDALFYAAKM